MKHVLKPPLIEKYLDGCSFDSILQKNRVDQALQKCRINSIIEIKALGFHNLLDKLRIHGVQEGDLDGLSSLIRPKIYDVQEKKDLDLKYVGINSIFPFQIRSGQLIEFLVSPGCKLMNIMGNIIEDYHMMYDHEVLYVDSNNTSTFLDESNKVKIVEVSYLDDIDHLTHKLEDGKFGLIIVNSISQILNQSYPGHDLETLSKRAIHIKRVLHRLKLYALESNLFVIYVNNFNIRLQDIKDNHAKFELIMNGGNIIRYAPHVRIHLYYNQGVKGRIIDSSYLPHSEFSVSLRSPILDEIF